jgi:hypothetical protein
MQWCQRNFIFQIITTELVDWIKEEIGINEAIEICAGTGTLGKALGITQTDAYIHEMQDVKTKFLNVRQPIPNNYPEYVEKLEALEAVSKYRPHTVIGSWVNQLGGPNIPQSSPYGVNEKKILKWVKKYIHIGSENTHAEKKILTIPHQQFKFKWLCSRAMDQSKNVIYVWGN